MSTTPKLIAWQFVDWDRQSSNELKLARLRLHIEEVAAFVVEHTQRSKTMRLDSQYLPGLRAERDRLEQRKAIAANVTKFGVSSFVRGSGP